MHKSSSAFPFNGPGKHFAQERRTTKFAVGNSVDPKSHNYPDALAASVSEPFTARPQTPVDFTVLTGIAEAVRRGGSGLEPRAVISVGRC